MSILTKSRMLGVGSGIGGLKAIVAQVALRNLSGVAAEPGRLWQTGPMSEPTFRDFAGAVMQGDLEAGGNVLKVLLGLDSEAARAAAENFAARMKSEGQSFMMKAMGLRTVLSDGTDQEIGELLSDLFGLSKEAVASGIEKLKETYR